MKIEMGESLFYSWLRHVKECQVVQTNWKASPKWALSDEVELERWMTDVGRIFADKFDMNVFKSVSLSQMLQQAEADAIGISMTETGTEIYAVDVAYHEAGLNYGDRQTTIAKVAMKCLRTAFCIRGYFNTDKAEIIFASPKIHNAVRDDLAPCMDEINRFFLSYELGFKARVIANEEFNELILKPILAASEGVADTAELFLRSYQLLQMFGDRASIPRKAPTRKSISPTTIRTSMPTIVPPSDEGVLTEIKIGKIANSVLRRILESGTISDEEIKQMQDPDYSHQTFHINFPLLVDGDTEYNAIRYYAKPLMIHNRHYYLCSQWFETTANNDRPYLIKWLQEHGSLENIEL
jgi:hypothetical protein